MINAGPSDNGTEQNQSVTKTDANVNDLSHLNQSQEPKDYISIHGAHIDLNQDEEEVKKLIDLRKYSKKLKRLSEDEKQEVESYIDQVWAEFDKDKSGGLNEQEASAFIQNIMDQIGEDFSKDIFEKFDKDGSGTIEKYEIVSFVKKMIGFDKALENEQ